MNRVSARHRVAGTIKSAKHAHRGHYGLEGATVYIEFDDGSMQAFGAFMSDEASSRDFTNQLLWVFRKQILGELQGQRCFALYAFGEHNEPIEGIECKETKLRLIRTTWARKFWAKVVHTPLENERRRLEIEIEHAERKIADYKQRLTQIDDEFVDWEKAT